MAGKQLRQDTITGTFVAIAEGRNDRPNGGSIVFEQKILPPYDADCPFCPGNENRTPPETWAYRNGDNWWVRGVPNKFPIFTKEEPQNLDDKVDEEPYGFFKKRPSDGIHEVVIETPLHNEGIAARNVNQIRELLWFYKEKLQQLREQGAVYVLIFKNYGKEAGESIVHSHSQIVAPPIPLQFITDEIIGLGSYFTKPNYRKQTEQCGYCDMVHLELEVRDKHGIDSEKNRVVAENPLYVAFAPYASRFPFQLMITPKSHQSDYSALNPTEADNLAEIVRDVFVKLEKAVPNVTYNMALHTVPLNTDVVYYHWHFEIAPRLVRMGSLDILGGINVNPIPPERVAMQLNLNQHP